MIIELKFIELGILLLSFLISLFYFADDSRYIIPSTILLTMLINILMLIIWLFGKGMGLL